MKKLIALITIAFVFTGCSNSINPFAKPDELPGYTFITQDGEKLMIEKATGETIDVTPNEWKRLKKLNYAAQKAYVARIKREHQ